MPTVGAIAGNTSPASWQISDYRGRLQQARREATQSQDTLRDLQAQTDRARSTAARAEDRLRGIEREAPQGQETVQPSIVNTQGQITGRVLNALA
jgi:predicted  nucleic acid-binding Zn-ribbon protein